MIYQQLIIRCISITRNEISQQSLGKEQKKFLEVFRAIKSTQIKSIQKTKQRLNNLKQI